MTIGVCSTARALPEQYPASRPLGVIFPKWASFFRQMFRRSFRKSWQIFDLFLKSRVPNGIHPGVRRSPHKPPTLTILEYCRNRGRHAFLIPPPSVTPLALLKSRDYRILDDVYPLCRQQSQPVRVSKMRKRSDDDCPAAISSVKTSRSDCPCSQSPLGPRLGEVRANEGPRNVLRLVPIPENVHFRPDYRRRS
jgi:hypothetical protein